MSEANYKVRTQCMLCSGAMTAIWGFRPSPLANSYRPDDEPNDYYPLQLSRCKTCLHIQCPVVVNPNLLFENYAYVSGTSPSFVRHFEDYARNLEDKLFLSPSSLVVEIGSNDGTMLRQFNCRTLGVDPSVNIVAIANDSGVETWCSFFNHDIAMKIVHERGFADLVVANNVMAHMEDFPGTVDAVKAVLTHNGAFVFEVSYGLDVFTKGLFDTVYHEHLHYHTVYSLDQFFKRVGMEIFDVEAVPTHGGSIRVHVAFPGHYGVHDSVAAFIDRETDSGILGEKIRETIHKIRNEQFRVSSHFSKISIFRRRGANVYGYGAPAKSVTLLNEFLAPLNFFEAIVDDNPLKQGMYHPLQNCPIISHEQFLKVVRPEDTVVILAWNFAEQIRQKIPSGITVYIPTLEQHETPRI